MGSAMGNAVDVHWQPTFADFGTPLSDVTFVVVDLETTGMHAGDAGITEIGAVKVRGGEVLGEFESLVNAGRPVSAFIARLTGITQTMVATAPDIEMVLPSFLEWARGSVLVAHNAPFDVGFLKAAARELGYEWPGFEVVDTLPLARRVVTKDEARDHKLGSLARVFHAEVDPNHRALADARATVDVLHGLFGRLGSLGVTHLEDLATAGDPVPVEIRRKANLADGLPEAPGVYQFIGPKDEVLYIGTSNNLRKRVRSYFTAAEKRKQITEMVRIAERVKPVVCATPLEAAVRELRLITEHRPRYNRRSKHGDRVYWLRLVAGPKPRLTVSKDLVAGAVAIGPFGSQISAREVLQTLHDAVPAEHWGVTMQGDPALVIGAYADKVARFAAAEQFEAAAVATARLKAFLGAAAKAQRLLPLAQCPELVAAKPAASGGWEIIIVKYGKLAGVGVCGRHDDVSGKIRTLRATAEHVQPGVAPMPAGLPEEAHLILNWLDQPEVRLVHAETPWALPVKSALAHVDLAEVSAAVIAATSYENE